MNVCMVSYSYYESDNRVRRYAESLVQSGDTVDVIAIRQKNVQRYENIRGVHVYRIQTREKNEKKKLDYLFRVVLFLVKSFFYLTWRHMRSSYDLVHVHSVPDFEVFAALVPKLFGAKVILDIHDIVPEFYAGKFNAGNCNFSTRALIRIERLCCEFADHVIISNDLWRKLLVSRSVVESKCTSVINYPDSTIFVRSKTKPDYNGGPFTIIYPGTLNYHQGVDVAVRAMARVTNEAPNVKFNIYGLGPLAPTLEELIQELKLQNSVFLYQILPLEKIAQKMGEAHLGIVPKRAEGFGNEAFSTKILEFMMLGVPVIASETKIDRYYFNDSLLEFFKSGDENNLAEKIIHLYNNKQRRDELVINALRFAKENNWSKKKTMYFEMINRLCGLQKVPDLVIQNANVDN